MPEAAGPGGRVAGRTVVPVHSWQQLSPVPGVQVEGPHVNEGILWARASANHNGFIACEAR